MSNPSTKPTEYESSQEQPEVPQSLVVDVPETSDYSFDEEEYWREVVSLTRLVDWRSLKLLVIERRFMGNTISISPFLFDII